MDDDETKVRQLAEKFGAVPFTFDFQTITKWQEYEKLCSEISQIGDVSVLVNNVEMFDKGKGKVYKTSDEDLIATVNANTFPVVFMSRFLGPKMS